MQFRNVGEYAMSEIDTLCEKYGIQIRSLSTIKEAFSGFQFRKKIYPLFFRGELFSVDDIRNKSVQLFKQYGIIAISQLSDCSGQQLKIISDSVPALSSFIQKLSADAHIDRDVDLWIRKCTDLCSEINLLSFQSALFYLLFFVL